MVKADCAAEMSLESAELTLERDVPSGLLESAFAGLSFCTSLKYFWASVVSPDLIADIRFVSAV